MTTLEDFIAKYPYTDFHEMNLDWLIEEIGKLVNEVTNFVSLNAIKYANPIQWDITRQYEKNTVVVDPMSGTAYLSVAAVPIGAQLNRTEYWTVIFDLGSFIVKAGKNFANTYEDTATTTATVNTPAGGWIMWGETLYVANVNITAGDAYVPGANITQITVEDGINAIKTFIGDLNDLNTVDKTSVVNAINEVLADIGGVDAKIGDLANLTTTDKDSVVDAINEVLDDVGDLSTLTTTDKTSAVEAINELVTTIANAVLAINTTIGDLDDLVTSDKSSVVNAINSISAALQANAYVTPEMFGAVGDGSNDDTAAFQAAFDTHKLILLQSGATYSVSNVTVDYGRITGGIESVIYLHGSITHTAASGLLFIENIRFIGDNTNNCISGRLTNTTCTQCLFYNFDTIFNETGNSYVGYVKCTNCTFRNSVHVFWANVSANYISFIDCVFNNLSGVAFAASPIQDLLFDHCDIENCQSIIGSWNTSNCSMEGITFRDCYFETNTVFDNDVAFNGGPGQYLGTVKFDGGYYNNTTATFLKFNRSTGYNVFLFIKGMHFKQIATGAIVLSARCYGEAEMTGVFTNVNKVTGLNNTNFSITLGGVKQN